MKHILQIGVLIACYTSSVCAETMSSIDGRSRLGLLVQRDYVDLKEQGIRSSSLGMIANGKSFDLVGLYSEYSFERQLEYGYPANYKSIDLLLDAKVGELQYVSIFKSVSDHPVSGGLSTYQIGATLGYPIVDRSNFSVILGAGFAFGDFDIETSSGETWPLIPVPLLRINYQSDLVETKFEFITSPNLSFTFYPQKRLRLTGDVRLDQARDARDVIFNFNLAYRFFSDKSRYGDFAGISLGIKNDNYGEFILGGKKGEETLEVHYYAAFVSLDLSLVKITGGYAFDGRELYRGNLERDVGNGAFISVQGIIPF